ncbi:MAG: hypothetical protein B193_1946 [Solidesulfovibrio magneticus str. Maddingley MBC34]|uniref:Uncharacterized protein n=1 Tax=Solidesulfovibrio magneticus str. Maddingley MBC34 TaxID=1206767 RepID=K6FL99_9BACT|nr:MAG: hypothetical protein B193_1946 [Solidesulfovibrio magneticus str. Maddingley MBC34]
MRSFIFVAILVFAALCVQPAQAFECGKLEFGAKLSDIDDGNFVRYMEKDGVVYYNYVGTCRLPVHQKASPAIAYAFVDGKYYARIIRVIGRGKKDILADMEKNFCKPVSVKNQGNVSLYQCDLPNDIEFKFKYDNKSGEARTAAYSKTLRQSIGKPGKADPADIPGK